MKKLLLILVSVFFIFGCMQNIPWEQRWANDYCNTIDWASYKIDPASESILCALAEKNQITLKEAQGVIFWTTALATLTDPDSINTIGEYTLKVDSYLQIPTMSLAGLFATIVDDGNDPRYAMIGNLINYSIFTYWGQDPLAQYTLKAKDLWLLRAHLNNVRNMIGYQVPSGDL